MLVRPPGREHERWRVAEERTRDELRMMGVALVEVEVGEEPAAIEHALAEHGSNLALRLTRENGLASATVWWQGAGELHAMRLDGLVTTGRTAAAVAGLRAAELVRTQILARGREDDAVPRDMSQAEQAGPAGMTSGTATSEDGARDRPPRLDPAAASSTSPEDHRANRVHAVDAQPNPGTRDRPLGASPASTDPTTGPEAQPPPAVLDPLAVIEAPPPEPSPRPTPQAGRARALGLHVTAGGGPGHAGALLGGAIALRWHLLRNLALAVDAEVAASPTWLARQDALLRLGLAGARATVIVVARPESRLSWRFGLAGGPSLAWAVARAAARPHESRDLVVVAALRATAQAAISLRTSLRLVLGLDVSVLLPPVAIRIQGAEAARLGSPLLRGTLGFEWSWRARTRR